VVVWVSSRAGPTVGARGGGSTLPTGIRQGASRHAGVLCGESGSGENRGVSHRTVSDDADHPPLPIPEEAWGGDDRDPNADVT
jgi:hypothetical protein